MKNIIAFALRKGLYVQLYRNSIFEIPTHMAIKLFNFGQYTITSFL